jgi:tRNA modification GTPase
MDDTATIAAISTPAGEGGIGIVRISGPRALPVAEAVFKPSSGRSPLDFPTHTIHHGTISDPLTGEAIDEALLMIMRAPRSYTGEDVVEIQGHGGPATMEAILESALQAGARLADPGEFTRRAFMGGRLDLAQAEAVIDLIRSRTEEARKAALTQLSGRLSVEVAHLRESLLGLVAEVEASLDLEEEEFQGISTDKLTSRAEEIRRGILSLVERSREGSLYQEGLKAVIAGKPNVGKSSLLNALLEEERAIVTPRPGTTRDTIEEFINLGGIPVKIVDTAGIHEARCEIEMEGVRRSVREVTNSPLVILVLDASKPIGPEDARIADLARGKNALIALNKTDLPGKTDRETVLGTFPGPPVIDISCVTHKGLEKLREALQQAATSGVNISGNPELTANRRHRQALSRAADLLASSTEAASRGMPLDASAADLRSALDALGEITGETATEDILKAIFQNFCVGK